MDNETKPLQPRVIPRRIAVNQINIISPKAVWDNSQTGWGRTMWVYLHMIATENLIVHYGPVRHNFDFDGDEATFIKEEKKVIPKIDKNGKPINELEKLRLEEKKQKSMKKQEKKALKTQNRRRQ